jgi:hypothetical protein
MVAGSLLLDSTNRRNLNSPASPRWAGRAVQCPYFLLGFEGPSAGGTGRWPARSLASRSL